MTRLWRFRIYSISPEGGAVRSWVIDRIGGDRVQTVYWRVPEGSPYAGGIRFTWASWRAAYDWLDGEGFAPSTVVSRAWATM